MIVAFQKIKQKSYMFDMYHLHKNDSETKLWIFSFYYHPHKVCLFNRVIWADLDPSSITADL